MSPAESRVTYRRPKANVGPMTVADVSQAGDDDRDEWVEVLQGVGDDDRWIRELTNEINDAFAGTKGVAFERLCRVVLEAAEPTVAKAYLTTIDSSDRGIDVIGEDEDGKIAVCAQCKHWTAPDETPNKDYTTDVHEIRAFHGSLESTIQRRPKSEHATVIRGIWITTGAVTKSARDLAQEFSDNDEPYTFEIWGPDALCRKLLFRDELNHLVRSGQRKEGEVIKDYVLINRNALRAFRSAKE